MVGVCFDAARKAEASRPPPPENTMGNFGEAGSSPSPQVCCPDKWEGEQDMWRLHHIGKRLFEVGFLAQRGFLPHVWPDCLAYSGSDALLPDADDTSNVAEGPACQPQPLVIEVSGRCLWDEGLLPLDLLEPVMQKGREDPSSPILPFGQQVIVRHLWSMHKKQFCEIARLKVLWQLACWPLCEDAKLIREALEYLKGAHQALVKGHLPWSLEAEQTVFEAFAALDLGRLPSQALMSPWVPAQVHAVRVLAQQPLLEKHHAELQEEISNATETLQGIASQCMKLSNRLNIVEQRTVLTKSHLEDTRNAILERSKRKASAPTIARYSS
eukprot:6190305-Amphidinium_carterae.1